MRKFHLSFFAHHKKTLLSMKLKKTTANRHKSNTQLIARQTSNKIEPATRARNIEKETRRGTRKKNEDNQNANGKHKQ